jgi:hypothetical protein
MSSGSTNKAPCHASPADIGVFPYTPPKNRNGRTSTVKTRKKYEIKSIPPNVITCLQVKQLLHTSTGSSNGITICSQCGSFELDHYSIERLRHLEDNNPRTEGVSIPKHFQCQTWWVAESDNLMILPSLVSPSSSPLSSWPTAPSHTPPILSKGHLMKSPSPQEDRPLRTTANYSVGRWTSTASNPPNQDEENDAPNNKKNHKKKARNKKKKNLTPESVSSSPIKTIQDSLQKYKRSKIEQICVLAIEQRKQIQAQQQKLESLNEELTRICKRHLDQISSLTSEKSSLTTEVHFQQAKRHRTEDTIKILDTERKKLNESLQYQTESLSTAQQQIASLTIQNSTLAREARESYKEGVRKGIEETSSNAAAKVDLPDELDAAGLSELIKNAFEIKHEKKSQAKRAEVAAKAIWHLYGGQCRPQLRDWTEEDIREQNPYRQAQEVAKVMDLSPGQLNLSGYKALREGLELRNDKGKIPKGRGWLCSDWYVKEAMYAIEREAEKIIPYKMLEGVDGFQLDYEKALVYLTDHVFDLKSAAHDRAQPRILWAFTVDGVSVSRNISLLIAGVKCIDP